MMDRERRTVDLLLATDNLQAAEPLLRDLLRAYSFHHQSHERGWAHLGLARVDEARSDAESAIRSSIQALRLLDPGHDPGLFRGAVRGLAVLFERCDRHRARFASLVREIREQRYNPGTLPWALHRWLEGRLHLLRGQHRAAASCLAGARRLLLARQAIPEAVLATLDQVEAYQAVGRGRKARLAARATLKAVEKLEAAGETVTALGYYVDLLCDGEAVDAASDRLRAELALAS